MKAYGGINIAAGSAVIVMTNESINKSVKSCPWCDEIPKIRKWVKDSGAFSNYEIGCENVDCPIEISVTGKDEIRLINDWNTRNG